MRTVFILLILTLGSCKTLEQKCLERFPSEKKEIVRETIKIDTITFEPAIVEIVDTTECLPSNDTVIQIKTIRKQLPPEIIYHETVCIDSVIIYEDAAKVKYLTEQLKISDSLHKAKKDDFRRLLVGAAIVIGSLMAIIGMILSRRFRKKS